MLWLCRPVRSASAAAVLHAWSLLRARRHLPVPAFRAHQLREGLAPSLVLNPWRHRPSRPLQVRDERHCCVWPLHLRRHHCLAFSFHASGLCPSTSVPAPHSLRRRLLGSIVPSQLIPEPLRLPDNIPCVFSSSLRLAPLVPSAFSSSLDSGLGPGLLSLCFDAPNPLQSPGWFLTPKSLVARSRIPRCRVCYWAVFPFSEY